ncbi:hypothetical protein [Stieleria mannarensis]|uniref:hypothetical protein n=1 Tax=Stieleria mannarensis TaxID=2755585 RepID=UPI0015FF52BA|nr:hypothetical protein [Rhodopirellula sp. JC639]
MNDSHLAMALRRLPGITVFVSALVMARFHLSSPGIAVGIAFVAFSLCLAVRSGWLWIVPTAIVAGSMYPVTGSLLVSFGDVFVVAAVASVLLRGRFAQIDRPLCGLLIALLIVSGVGAVRGWISLPESRWDDQLNLYLSQLNAASQFKGYLMGTLLAAAFFTEFRGSPGLTWNRLVQGIRISALVVAIIVLIERSFAYGVFEFSTQFRATGPCTSMHIGGQHIDGYWALALPFLLFVGRKDVGHVGWRGAFNTVVQVVSIYAIFVTMSRSTVALAAGFVLASVVVHTWAWISNRMTKRVGLVGASVMAMLLVAMWFAGGAVKRRYETTRADLQVRIDHMKEIVVMSSDIDPFLGRGLGTYPLEHRRHRGLSESLLRVSGDAGQGGIVAQPDPRIYLEQFVDPNRPGPWDVQLRYAPLGNASDDHPASWALMVCHKTLLQSYGCVRGPGGATIVAPMVGSGGLMETRFEIDVSQLRQRRHERRWDQAIPPTTLSLIAHGSRPLRLDSIDVVDADGEAVLRNGDFAQGSRWWYFTGGDHLVWRAKNAWLHTRVELGWTGVLLWLALTVLLGWRSLKMLRSTNDAGDAAELNPERGKVGIFLLVGWISMSLFGTLLDTPWIVQSLYLTSVAITVKLPQDAADT